MAIEDFPKNLDTDYYFVLILLLMEYGHRAMNI